jgi:hypothetical protein
MDKGGKMNVGDLVRFGDCFGVVTYVDPEEIGDTDEVEVAWTDGTTGYHSTSYLEKVQ